MGRRLTQVAHELVSATLPGGGVAVDATAGNGYDTCFLARCVGPGGHVYAFDVQRRALDATCRRLAAQELTDRVTLCHAGHERLAEMLPARLHGRIDAAMFNLGYLPGAPHDITTRSETSTDALHQAAALLRPAGIVTVLAYRGHPGGDDETEAIGARCATLAARGFDTHREESPGSGPVLWILRAPAT